MVELVKNGREKKGKYNAFPQAYRSIWNTNDGTIFRLGQPRYKAIQNVCTWKFLSPWQEKIMNLNQEKSNDVRVSKKSYPA